MRVWPASLTRTAAIAKDAGWSRRPGASPTLRGRPLAGRTEAPFGVTYLWDPVATVALAAVTSATFARFMDVVAKAR